MNAVRFHGHGALCALSSALLALFGGLVQVPLLAAEELPPVEVVRMLRSARIDHQRGDTPAELATLRAAAEAYPGEMTVTLALLDYHRHHGLPADEHARLQEDLQRRLDAPSGSVPLPVVRQMAIDPESDPELLRALAAYLESRSRGPEGLSEESVDVLELLADLRMRLGRQAEAATALAALWQRTDDLEVGWRLLRLRFDLGDRAGALDLMEQVPVMRENRWPTYVSLLAEAGRFEDARAELERRIERTAPVLEALGEVDDLPLDPDLDAAAGSLAAVAEGLAWAHRDAGRDAEAEELFRLALDLRPGDPHLDAVLLHLYASEAEREVVAAEVARSWQAESDPRRLFDEGTQRLASGDAEGAFDLLDRAAPHLPALEAAWYNLGMAAYRLERWPRAAEALGKAAELNPDRAANEFFRGIALSHLERCPEAVDALERALELDAGRKDAHYYLAGCLRAMGRTEEAERHRALYSGG